jgi:hypothetical protein
MPAALSDATAAGHWTVEVDGTLVRCVRTRKGFTSTEDVATGYGEMVAALRQLDRTRYVLLVDLRRAVGRNDKGFEDMVRVHRRAQLTWFARSALLVHSKIGQLQVERHMREDGLPVPIFCDEAEALAFLGV